MKATATPTSTPLRSRPAWRALETHFAEVGGLHLRDMFAGDEAALRSFWGPSDTPIT